MKKLTKTFMAVAAVTAVSAAMSVSAMAMSAEYDSGNLIITGIEGTGASQTLLVLTADETVTSENANEIVKQIDQKDNDGTNDGSFEGISVPVGEIADGTHLYIRISGSNGNLQKYDFVVGGTGGETTEITIGDVSGDNAVDGADTTMISRYIVSSTKSTGNTGDKATVASDNSTIVIGDVSGDNAVDGADTTMISRYIVSSTKSTGNTGDKVIVNAE